MRSSKSSSPVGGLSGSVVIDLESAWDGYPNGFSQQKFRRHSRQTLRTMLLKLPQKSIFLLPPILLIFLICAILAIQRSSGSFFAPSNVLSTPTSIPPNLVTQRIRRPRTRPSPFPDLRNLVIVAGHSIYTSARCESANSEDAWFLEPYQRLAAQASTFVEHIKLGVSIAAADSKSLLLFSGGQTRKQAGPRTEAQSYWAVAQQRQWFEATEVEGRALTEEHARDSFENLMFSVCRFRELTGAYPENITLVSYDYKKRRFSELHREAIRFPRERFVFLGTPSANDLAEAFEKKTAEAFAIDPYGCTGKLLQKKEARNPFARGIPYPMGCPELEDLFSHCGSTLYNNQLPWT